MTLRELPVGWVFLLAGAFFLVLTAWYGWWTFACRRWPVAKGRIVSAHVGKRLNVEGPDTPYVAVAYEYVVAGQTYDGTRWRFGYRSHFFRDSASRAVAAYQPGAAVEVRHHPTRPWISVLEPVVDSAIFINLGFGIVFGELGIFVLVLSGD